MALTKVTGHVIKSDTNIISHNINSSGIITAVTFDGNVSGVAVTFTGDSTIGSLGITTNLTVGGNIDVDGQTNLDHVSIAGVTSTSDNVRILGTNKLQFADNQSLQIYYDNSSYITNNNAGHLFLKTLNGGSDIRLEANDDIFLLTAAGTRNSIICRDYAQVELYYNNTKRLETTNTGAVISGILTVTGNMNVEGVLTYQDVTNIDSIGIITARSNIVIPNDTGKILIGASQDLQIYHDFSGGSENSHIKQTSNKHLQITAHTTFNRITGTWGVVKDSNSHNIIRANAGSDVKLYFNNTERITTTGYGATITGITSATSFTASESGVSGQYKPNEIKFDRNSYNFISCTDNSGQLVIRMGSSQVTAFAVDTSADTIFSNNRKIKMGSGNKLQLYSDGSNSLITDSSSAMFVRSNRILFQNSGGTEGYGEFNQNGSVYWTHDNVKRIETTATGIEVTGEVAASQDYPTTRPTLDFNFAAEKKLDPRITFYRTTIGSYIDENGDYRWASANQPKFNHDEVTHESKGLLIEPARTNLLTSGNNIPSGGNSGGNPGPSLVANNVEAPDGSFTARTVDYSNASSNMNSANIEFSWDNTPAGKTYSASIWVKGTQGHTINMYLDASGQGSGNLNEAKIHRTLTGKWQRMSVYYTYPSGANAAFLRVGTRSLHGLTQGTATVVSFWGTTVVEESQPGSTIATPIVSVTTAPDYALIDGEDFTEFFNQVEGTIITSTDTLDPAGVRRPAVIEGDVTNNDRHYIQEAGAYQYQIKDGGTTVAQIDAGAVSIPKNIIAAAYKLNDAAVSINGSDAVTDTSATMPTCTKLKLGEWSSTFYFGHISRFMYYRNRIPNSQLKTLSSQ